MLRVPNRRNYYGHEEIETGLLFCEKNQIKVHIAYEREILRNYSRYEHSYSKSLRCFAQKTEV
jgi:hypothetical protein